MSGLAMKSGSLLPTSVGEEGVSTGWKFSLRSIAPWRMSCSVAHLSTRTSPWTGRGGELRTFGVPSPALLSRQKISTVCRKIAPLSLVSSSSVGASMELWKYEMVCMRLAV